jgi:hypothetical protein
MCTSLSDIVRAAGVVLPAYFDGRNLAESFYMGLPGQTRSSPGSRDSMPH